MLQKPWDTLAKGIAGVGALNVGLTEFANINILNWLPEGMAMNIGVGLVGASGIYLLYLLMKKKL